MNEMLPFTQQCNTKLQNDIQTKLHKLKLTEYKYSIMNIKLTAIVVSSTVMFHHVISQG